MTSFIQSHPEHRENLDKTLTFLSNLRPFTVKEQKRVEDEIANAVARAQGPIVGKL